MRDPRLDFRDSLASTAQQIGNWLDEYLVVVLRGQLLEPAPQRELVAHFEPLFEHPADDGVTFADGLPEVLEMRKEPDGARLFGGSDWHMSRIEFTFRHRWREGDLVLWDNRFTLPNPINDLSGHRRLQMRRTALESRISYFDARWICSLARFIRSRREPYHTNVILIG